MNSTLEIGVTIWDIPEIVDHIVSFLNDHEKICITSINNLFNSVISTSFNLNQTFGRWRYAFQKIKTCELHETLKTRSTSFEDSKFEFELSERVFIPKWGVYVKLISNQKFVCYFVIWSILQQRSHRLYYLIDIKDFFAKRDSSAKIHFQPNNKDVIYHVNPSESFIISFSERFDIGFHKIRSIPNKPTIEFCGQTCLKCSTYHFWNLPNRAKFDHQIDTLWPNCLVHITLKYAGKFGIVSVLMNGNGFDVSIIKCDKNSKISQTIIYLTKSIEDNYISNHNLLVLPLKHKGYYQEHRIINLKNLKMYEISFHVKHYRPQFFKAKDFVFGYQIGHKCLDVIFDKASHPFYFDDQPCSDTVTFCKETNMLLVRFFTKTMICINVAKLFIH